MKTDPDFTEVIKQFSTISKLSKEMYDEHKKGLLALQRICRIFERCDKAAQSGDPKKILKACANLNQILPDLSAYSASATREAEVLSQICFEVSRKSAPETLPPFPSPVGYA